MVNLCMIRLLVYSSQKKNGTEVSLDCCLCLTGNLGGNKGAKSDFIEAISNLSFSLH